MNRTQLTKQLRTLRTPLLALGMGVFAIISVGAIWYMRTAGSVAPTAPDSQPAAAGNQCTLEFTVADRCNGLKTNMPLARGRTVIFECAGSPSTDRYVFRIEENPGGVREQNSPSRQLSLVVRNSLKVSCQPCTGDICAPMQEVEANCTIRYPVGGATPLATPTTRPTAIPTTRPTAVPTVRPTATPTPIATPSTIGMGCRQTCDPLNGINCQAGFICAYSSTEQRSLCLRQNAGCSYGQQNAQCNCQ